MGSLTQFTSFSALAKRYVVLTALRAAWIWINSFGYGHISVVATVIPLPWAYFAGTSQLRWGVDAILTAFQAVAVFRVFQHLLVRHSPDYAAKLGGSGQPSQAQIPAPRNQSWLPTAALLCVLVILSCCAVGWIFAQARYHSWIPFEDYVYWEGRMPLWIGVVLSVLGFMFGGQYIARASGDVSTRFGVARLDGDHWLTQRVYEIAEKLNLPKPAVGITEVTNAFAMGASQKDAMVVIGKPLLAYDRDELDAIIGHELGHVLHNDVARMQFAEGFQQMLGRVSSVVTVIGAFFIARAANSRQGARTGAQLTYLTGGLVRRTLFIGSEMVTKGISRSREFHADAVGASVTSPDAMSRALQRIHGVVVKPTPEERQYGYLMFRGAGFGNLFSTHPTLAARLRALNPTSSAIRGQRSGALPNSSAFEADSGLGVSTGSLIIPKARLAGRAFVSARLALKGLAVRILEDLRRMRLRRLLKPLIAMAVLWLLVAGVGPALVSFYALDRRLSDAEATVAGYAQSSWGWLTDHEHALAAALGLGTTPQSPPQVVVQNPVNQQQAAQISVIEATLDSVRRALGARQAELNKITDQLRAAEQDAQLARQQGAEAVARANQASQDQINTLTVQRDALQANVNYLTGQLQSGASAADKTAGIEIGRLQVANDALGRQLSAAIRDGERQREGLQQQIVGLQAQLAEAKQTSAVPAGDTNLALIDQVRQLTVDRDGLQRQSTYLSDQLQKAGAVNASLVADKAAVGAEMIDLQAKLKDAQDKAQPATRALWGAAAVDQRGRIQTIANQTSKDGAEKVAMKLCESAKGGRCRLIDDSAFNNMCFSVARVTGASSPTPDNFGIGKATNWQMADAAAVSDCQGFTHQQCSYKFRACSPDALSGPD